MAYEYTRRGVCPLSDDIYAFFGLETRLYYRHARCMRLCTVSGEFACYLCIVLTCHNSLRACSLSISTRGKDNRYNYWRIRCYSFVLGVINARSFYVIPLTVNLLK